MPNQSACIAIRAPACASSDELQLHYRLRVTVASVWPEVKTPDYTTPIIRSLASQTVRAQKDAEGSRIQRIATVTYTVHCAEFYEPAEKMGVGPFVDARTQCDV